MPADDGKCRFDDLVCRGGPPVTPVAALDKPSRSVKSVECGAPGGAPAPVPNRRHACADVSDNPGSSLNWTISVPAASAITRSSFAGGKGSCTIFSYARCCGC